MRRDFEPTTGAESHKERNYLPGVLVGATLLLLLSPWGKAAWEHLGSRGLNTAAREQTAQDALQYAADLKQQMRSAVRCEDWQHVTLLGQELIEIHDLDGQVWRWMGSAYLHLGDYDRAEIAWKQALREPVFRTTSLYGLARSQALQDKKAEAIEALEEAIDKGYATRIDVLADQAFFPLRGEARFEQMIEETQSVAVHP